MTQDLYTIEQVAGLLGLHVKTVRNYVRDGKLRAVRIGKSYRVARQDVEALTGAPIAAPLPVRRQRHVDVSCVVDIDAIGKDAAMRLTTFVTASVRGRPADDAPVRVETVYDEERARLKVIISGSLDTTRTLLAAIKGLAERSET
jgi:excisionase family DNA binding protein